MAVCIYEEDWWGFYLNDYLRIAESLSTSDTLDAVKYHEISDAVSISQDGVKIFLRLGIVSGDIQGRIHQQAVKSITFALTGLGAFEGLV